MCLSVCMKGEGVFECVLKGEGVFEWVYEGRGCV